MRPDGATEAGPNTSIRSNHLGVCANPATWCSNTRSGTDSAGHLAQAKADKHATAPLVAIDPHATRPLPGNHT